MASIPVFWLACSHGPPGLGGGPGVAPAPGILWVGSPADRLATPPVSAGPALTADEVNYPELPEGLQRLRLTDVLTIALARNPETRASWAAARSADAAYRSRRGDWLPDVNLSAGALRSQSPSSRGESGAVLRRDDLSADLSLLLFNFGGRRASIEESRQALLAANWSHNATVQAVIFGVEQGYYRYLAAAALRDAQQRIVLQAQANLEAAQARHDAGLATIADVLQAQTARSQAQLTLDDLEGTLLTTRGALATSMGLPATTEVELEAALEAPPADTVLRRVDGYLESAMERRPDLAAARAQAARSRAHATKVKTEAWPSLTFGGSAGRSYYEATERYGESWSALLQARVPLFTGLSHHYEVRQAEADRDAAEARLEKSTQAAILDVWTSWAELKTAAQRLRTTEDLVTSATASEAVAAGRYREGVGSILDLLSAESALAHAQAQQILARSDWYIALARLSLATGNTLTAQERSTDAPHP